MTNSSFDLKHISGLNNESRQAVTAAFDALSNWREEVSTANDRCMTKVLDQMSAAARTLGWPEHVIRTTQRQLLSASKMQAQMIDQIMDAWEQQLKSPTTPMGIPRGFAEQMPGLSGSMSEMMPNGAMAFAPWKLWLQAAETWQRNWMAAMSAWSEARSSRHSSSRGRSA